MKVFELYAYSEDGSTSRQITHTDKTKEQFEQDVKDCTKNVVENMLSGIGFDFDNAYDFILPSDLVEKVFNLMISRLEYKKIEIECVVSFGEDSIIGTKHHNTEDIQKLIGSELLKKVTKRNGAIREHPDANYHFVEFYNLLNKLKNKHKFSSVFGSYFSDEDYVSLKSMGKPIVPYLIDDNSEGWISRLSLFLLHNITGLNPFDKDIIGHLSEKDKGNLESISKWWEDWFEYHKNDEIFKRPKQKID